MSHAIRVRLPLPVILCGPGLPEPGARAGATDAQTSKSATHTLFSRVRHSTYMNDDLFERILVPIASPDDAEATARALRPHLDADTTLIVAHVTQGTAAETAVKTGRDQFTGATYEKFVDILYRDDLQFEWTTLEGREVAEALIDAVDIVEATLVAFTPRDMDTWERTIAGDPGGKLIREADVPVMVFPNQQA